MAEIIISPVIQLLFEKLSSVALEKLARSKGIYSELKKWERSLLQIQDVLLDAAEKEISKASVKRWLDGLRHLAYDIDDLLDELDTKAMHRQLTDESGASTSKVRKLIPTCCTNFSLSTRISGRLDDITTKLKNLEKEKTSLGLIVKDGKSKSINRRLETCLVDVSSIIGRVGDKKVLLQKLLGDEPSDQNFSIVPIVGLGGIGKTTLAKFLFDDTQVTGHFELKAWVCVSDEFDIFKISKSIFQNVGGGTQEFADLNLLQVALKGKLLERRFLLVLDDVWSESYSDWEKLTRPFLVVAPGSKIIITTRKQQLLQQMGYDKPHAIQTLSEEDALSLFSQHALGENNFDSHPTLKPYGKDIVKKCGGLPLALKALGRSLRTKTEEEEWKDVLNSEIWSLQNEVEIIPALRISYLDLPAHLKQLFESCSLFPKDYVFDKEELILLWMAEGFLHQSTSTMSTERFGRKCFEELLSRSFFQVAPNEESLYVMHDLMNDLATFVAGDFFFRFDYEKKADVKNEALEKHRHMSFVCQRYEVYQKFKMIEEAKSLRTLLAVSIGEKKSWQRFFLSNKVLVELLPQLPLLRVLSLSGYKISEVPESIGNLRHLRYLNLSRTEIKRLPEQVGSLYNLQTLLVCGCRRLETLPSSFLKLKNLRHLDMSDTPLLEKMPLGIGELRSLQTLSKVIIEGGNGFALTELKNLNDLHGRLSIKRLDKVQNANLLEKEVDDLEMEWSDVFDGARNETLEKEVLNMLKPRNDKLRKLGIVSYGGLEFPSWVGDPLFFRLTHVTIRGCEKCTSLPPLGQLPSLKELAIEGMNGIKVVGPELLGNGIGCGGVAFPLLEILSFKKMQGWEVWSTNSGDTGTSFPYLEKLHIKGCGNLVEASLEAIPSLRVLKISGCGDGVLTSLVQVTSSITKLEMDDISGLTRLDEGILKYLGAVEEVVIKGCNEVRYLWESEAEACKILVNLRKLEVRSCDNLVGIGEKEEDNCGSSLTSLRQVEIYFCNSLERYSCPNGIEGLGIFQCNSITSVSFPRGGQKLKLLIICGCVNLLEEEESGEKHKVLPNSSMSLLEDVYIDNWSNLKSFPDLSCFLHLTSLGIGQCKNLESFPDKELPKLTSLTSMVIKDCPSMDDSFPGGHWPPKLSLLGIGGLKKPISEWGPQNFPSSLVDLRLYGRSSSSLEDVVSGSELSNLLPSSLTSLGIRGFKKLESVSVGLQHLTSLQHLGIYNCPKINDLPETLLPSLLVLGIQDCPKLKERCSRTRRGSYWPHISHIPCVRIIESADETE